MAHTILYLHMQSLHHGPQPTPSLVFHQPLPLHPHPNRATFLKKAVCFTPVIVLLHTFPLPRVTLFFSLTSFNNSCWAPCCSTELMRLSAPVHFSLSSPALGPLGLCLSSLPLDPKISA